MNGMVDSRVVEMHFDNSDFMKKIGETIESLEKLNEQISAINASKGLSNLGKNAGSDLSNVEKAVGNIEGRFSTLGIVGMTIIQRLTNAGINGVTKVASLLGAAARQARTGGFIRAQNIEQAKFLLEGLGADVEAVFKRVDTAVTGTAYGIDEAAKAAASFWASGITDLDKLQDSLRAIAGVASMTGSDFASIADIFTTVAGQGKVMTMQLRMMEGRGLNAAATMAKFFSGVNNGSIEASDSIKKAVKELTSSTEVSEEAIRDFVSKGKINFELFSAAMDNAFGEHAQEANKTFSGSLANLKTSLSRLGEAFYTPAMKAAIPVFNSLRESFSNLTNDLKKSKTSYEIDKIVSSIEKAGKLKGNGPLVALSNLTGLKSGEILLNFLNGVTDGSKEASAEVTKAVKEITGGAKIAYEDLWKLEDEGKITFEIFSAAFDDVLKKYKSLSNISSMVNEFSNVIQGIGNHIAATIRKFNESEVIVNIAQSIYNSFRILRTIFSVVRESFNEVFTGSAIKSLENLTADLAENTKKAADWLLAWQNIEPFKNVMIGLFSGLKAGFNIIKGFVKVITSAIGSIFGFSAVLNDFTRGFRDAMQKINEKTGTIGIFDKLAKLLDGIGDLADRAFKKLANGFGTLIRTIGEGLGDIEKLTQAFVGFGLVLAGLSAMKNYKIIKYRLGLVTGGIGRFIQILRIADLQDMGSAIRDILDSTKRALAGLTHEIKTKILKDLAYAILALAVGLKLLETIDASKLATSIGAITALMAEMTAVLVILLSSLGKASLTESFSGVLAIGSISNALIKIAVAMLLMAGALKMIAELDPKELAIGLTGLTVMLGAVLGFILALDKWQKLSTDKSAALLLLGVAASLMIMAEAVKILSSMNVGELAKGLGSIIVLLGAVFGFLAGISKAKVTMGPGLIAAGIGMIAIAAAINILAPALERIGSMPLEQLANGLEAIIAAMISMAIASDMASLSGGAGMFMMALAIASLTTSLERIASLDVGSIAKGFITIAIALGIMIAATAVLSIFSGTLLIVGGAMLMFSGSVLLFGAGLVLIGTGLTTISAGIMSFAAVTVTAIETFIHAITTMVVELAKAIPVILEALLSNLVKTMEILDQYTPQILEFLTKLLDMLIQLIIEYAPKLIATGVELGIMLILGLLDGLAQSIGRIVDKGVDVAIAFLEGVGSRAEDMVDAGIELIIDFINGLAEGIRTHKRDFRDAIENLCTAGLEAFLAFFGIASPSKVMEEQGGFLVEGLKNGIENAGDIGGLLISAVSSGLEKVKSTVSKYAGQGKELVKGIGSGIKDKAGDIKDKVIDAVKKAKDKIADSSAVSKWKSAGKSLTEGISKGIKNGLSSLISATGSIATKALNHFKSKLKISSPSKVFAEAGRWIPEGIAVGINKTSRKVENAVEYLADSTVDAMSTAISKAYDILDAGDNFNPVITPVLDLSQVKNEAGNISSMFGTESISLASTIGQNDIQNIQNNNLMNQLLMKMDRMLNTNNTNPVNISNTFTVNGNDNPEEFVNTFIRTLDREMQMRAV